MIGDAPDFNKTEDVGKSVFYYRINKQIGMLTSRCTVQMTSFQSFGTPMIQHILCEIYKGPILIA